jgi:hypothetical protein
VDLLRLGLDAGYLAQIMRLNRNPVDRATAFYGAFYCDNVGYVIELIEHIPGEPLRATRERALPRAIEFLRQNLNRRFGDLGKEQQAEIVKAMPQPGSPAAKARGITRAPTDSDPLHEIRLQPFFQLLDLEEPLDQAQGLWFLKEVFRQRLDLAQLWLEPALPRLRQLLGSADERVRAQAIELVQVVGPKDLVAPPDDDRARVDWANAAWKTLFPPIRNQNDAIVELHPSPERDALAAAAVAALETSAIGDPYAKRHDDGKWVRGFRVARVPDELKPLAIPAGAIITAVNGLGVSDAATLLRTVRRQLEIAKHPRSLILEYLRDGTTHAVEYRLR